jgi:hypothetical protein
VIIFDPYNIHISQKPAAHGEITQPFSDDVPQVKSKKQEHHLSWLMATKTGALQMQIELLLPLCICMSFPEPWVITILLFRKLPSTGVNLRYESQIKNPPSIH